MIYDPVDIDAHRAKLSSFHSATGRIAYLDHGTGKTIFLIHGTPTHSWLYHHIIPSLVEAGYRVIVPDMLGFGRSDMLDIMPTYSLAMYSQRMLELKRHLQIDTYDLVLHDAGGPWTYSVVLETHSDLLHMVLFRTIVYADGFKPPVRPKENSLFSKILAELYDSRVFGKLMVNSTLRSVADKHKMSRQERRGYWRSISPGSDTPIRYFFTPLDEMVDSAELFRKAVSGSDIDVSVIWGKTDVSPLADILVPLLRNHFSIPDNRVHVLEATSHFLMEKEPDTVASLISQSIRA